MLTLQDIMKEMQNLDNWLIDGPTIVKVIEFKDFKEAMTFANKVAEISEKHNHHPEILINYNVVRLTLTTHSVKALTEIDFKLAEEIDKIKI